MKPTGIIRRIDDLGRIVIPKEIRKNLRIKEGDSLELYLDNDSNIILKKYYYNIYDLSKRIIDIFTKIFNKSILITNKEKVIISSKDIEDYTDKDLSSFIKESIDKRLEVISSNNIILEKECSNYYMLPLIVNSDTIGSIIVIDNNIDNNLKNIIRLINLILVKDIEV